MPEVPFSFSKDSITLPKNKQYVPIPCGHGGGCDCKGNTIEDRIIIKRERKTVKKTTPKKVKKITSKVVDESEIADVIKQEYLDSMDIIDTEIFRMQTTINNLRIIQDEKREQMERKLASLGLSRFDN